MASVFHVGDIGTKLVFAVKEDGAALDISSSTGWLAKIQKPDGTTINSAASFNTDGIDGKLKYVFGSGDLDQSGKYEAQGYFVLGAWQGHTEKIAFEVFGNAI